MKKQFLFILFLLVLTNAQANMANPIQPGTECGRPFVNENVDVVKEDINITINQNFETANFKVKYFINSSKDGINIPFLFFASECLNEFTVKVDGNFVDFKLVSDYYNDTSLIFVDFDYLFANENGSVELNTEENYTKYISLGDMLYFETDISEGEHIIEVSYNAKKWIDGSDHVNEYSIRYDLSPASYWKSFQNLTITLNNQSGHNNLQTNLGKPTEGDLNSNATWHFVDMPVKLMLISYKPKIEGFTAFLLNGGTFWLALIISIMLAIGHFFLIKKFRKKYESRFSLPTLFGSLIIPLIFFILWFYFISTMFNLLGDDAGQAGYYFLVIVFYIAIMPVYMLVFFVIDYLLKLKFHKN